MTVETSVLMLYIVQLTYIYYISSIYIISNINGYSQRHV